MAQILVPLRASGSCSRFPVHGRRSPRTLSQEASIADISYLFEEGALVDFEIEELVKLVKALFADTPLRANTINKLQQGHPVRGS